MTLEYITRFKCFLFPWMENVFKVSPASSLSLLRQKENRICFDSSGRGEHFCLSLPKFLKLPSLGHIGRSGFRAARIAGGLQFDDGKNEGDKESRENDDEDGVMDEEERREWRKKIREVIDRNPEVVEEVDPEERRIKMQKLLAEYPLVVEEDDPEWPEDADGWGFNLGQFFNKITIKNVRKDDDDNYDSDKELVWQDDNYIRPIKDITTAEWEETVLKDISPLIVLVHNRYKSVLQLMQWLSMIWSQPYKYPFSQNLYSLKRGRYCTVRKHLERQINYQRLWLSFIMGRQSHLFLTLLRMLKRQSHWPQSEENNHKKAVVWYL